VIDVMIVADNPTVRHGLRRLLQVGGDVRVVAQARGGRKALAVARRLRPAVTLLDSWMPAADRLAMLDALTSVSSVLVLGDDPDPDLVAAMLRGGARGFLVHGRFDQPELVRAIVAVADGQGWLSPAVVSIATSALREQVVRERARREDAERQREARRRFGLTEREQEVVELLCQGLSNASIAERLLISEKTVKNHLNHIFAKLRVSNRTEAVVHWTAEA
jgi:DNA-binding NarL/FixJ family response regulator